MLQQLAQLTVNGIITGTILALTGVGMTLVFGIQRIANFAHGEYLTFGSEFTGTQWEYGRERKPVKMVEEKEKNALAALTNEHKRLEKWYSKTGGELTVPSLG